MDDLDYKAMVENAFAVIKKQVDLEEEYFSSIRTVQELNPYTNVVTENLFNMKMADQMLIFRVLVQSGEVAKYLCEKYELKEGADCLDFELGKFVLDLINRQKAEIERLREHIELLDIEHEAIEISAIKEFAERFKSKAWVDKTLLGYPYYNISFRTFNNLVKEMVGESND